MFDSMALICAWKYECWRCFGNFDAVQSQGFYGEMISCKTRSMGKPEVDRESCMNQGFNWLQHDCE